MAQLETNFAGAPYWDDYEPSKNYYRVLFIPKRAVQTREVNQVQAIFQEQIRRFGDHTFKDGSIVDGCNVIHHTLNFVRIENSFNEANGNIAFDENIYGFLLVSRATGLRASIRLVKRGWVLQYPDTNTLYVDYISTGTNSADQEITFFQPGEVVDVYTSEQDKFGSLLPANLYNNFNVIVPVSGATPEQFATGVAAAVTVGEGIVYQKGFFVGVNTHTIAIKPYDTDTTNMVVGFQTLESIVTHLQDRTLIDPSDTSQRNAIGADRLHLRPVLVSRDKTTFTDKDDFFPIIEYNEREPIVQNIDPEYARLGDVMHNRTYEESGDYYVKPFLVSTQNAANTANLRYAVNPGIAYVKGNRVELIATNYLETKRATDTESTNAAILTLNYGNYVVVDELVGTFPADKMVEIDIYNAAQRSITNNNGSTPAPTGTKVGTAIVRAIVYNTGTKSAPNAQYRLYLFNIKMNSGQSFTNSAKAFHVNGTYGRAKADIVLESGKAVIKDAGQTGLVFDLGFDGVKRLRDSQGINDTQFMFRSTSTATLQSNGSVTFTLNMPHAGGLERFFSSAGNLSQTNELRVDISTSAAAATDNLPGTIAVTAKNVVGTGTSFLTSLKVGDTIRVSGSTILRIESITSNTAATVATAPGSNIAAGATYAKYFLPGSVLDLDAATVNVSSNTQFTVNMGSSFALGAPQTLTATYPVFRSQAVEMKKAVRRNIYVRIDCSTAGTVGPFNLGLTDVFQIQGAWVGGSYAESNPDRAAWFNLDSGQNESFYDHGKLVLKPQFKGKLTSASRILVKLSYFESNNVTGAGFYSVDSYPVRLPGVAANTTNISYAEIPRFGSLDLRECIDFRPSKYNTATAATTIATGTINPAVANSSFVVASSGIYLAEPDSNFQADAEYFLPRIDLVQVNKDGNFSIKSSIPNIAPTTPLVDNDSMPVAVINVPAYPSLTGDERGTYAGANQVAQATMKGNRGYTMRDVNTLDQRITRLEWYTTLSMLEAQAKDYTVLDENGLDRFKNGIFADPFKNHMLGDVTNFEYTIAIDEGNAIARPRFQKYNIDLKVGTKNNVVVEGRVAKLPSTKVLFAEQSYASKFRNVTESVWNWAGNVQLFPDYDYFRDEVSAPDVNFSIDLASPWEDFANSPFGMNYGEWRVSSTADVSSSASTASSSATSGRTTTTTNTTTTTTTTNTTTTSERTNTNLNVASSLNTQNLGSYVTDFTLNPYMRAREVAVVATSLKPNTRYWFYFDKEPVSEFVAPATFTNRFNPEAGVALIESGKESDILRRTGNFGTAIKTNANGDLYAVFKIPAGKFRVGERELYICNVDNIVTGKDAVTSAARVIYVASSLTVTKNEINISTIEPTISSSSSNEKIVDTSTNITSRTDTTSSSITIPNQVTITPRISDSRGDGGGRGGGHDPLGQSFYIGVPNNVPGIFVASLEVFFKSKDPTLGATCYICGMSAGVPDTSKIVAKSYLKASAIKVSDNGSQATEFNFPDNPYLTNDTYYAFFIRPDGDSPEYTMWMAEVGGVDIVTGIKIFSNPYIGTAFKSANSESWDVLQTEDVKFRLNRCNFTSLNGTITMFDEDDEYITVQGINYKSAGNPIQIGDVVYSQNGSGVVQTGANQPFAVVQDIDVANDQIVLDSSRGGLTAGMTLQVHRPAEVGNTAAISETSRVATTTIASVDNIEYSIIVPRIGTITPAGTDVNFKFKGRGVSNVRDPAWRNVQAETDLEMTDQTRLIRSKSNRSGELESVQIECSLATGNSYTTPIVDLRRNGMYVIKNLINDTVVGEETRYGEAMSKYISRRIILAEGQDAEDLKVYVTGYRPFGTNIHCFVKILNADDSANFEDKQWTELEMTEGASVNSSIIDVNDFREFGYSFPTSEASQGQAFKNLANIGIVQYRDSSGSIFIGYKSFAIKLVLTSNRKERIPRMADVRSLALQI